MARIRFYVATSLDGFIADREGSVEWLAPYDARLYGYDKFVSEVGALIMGRRTYELIFAIGEDWPYNRKPVYVLSSTSLGDVPPGVVTTTRHRRRGRKHLSWSTSRSTSSRGRTRPGCEG